jgi:glycosyltransferase involved in cell wall biosynthesis
MATVALSVVVCTRNRVNSLRRCLHALSLVGTARNWEIVIVDNGSSDGTQKFLESLPSKVGNARTTTIFHPKPGLGSARNAGWRSSEAEIIAFTDDDCYVAWDYVDMVLAQFDKTATLGFIGGRVLLHEESVLRHSLQEREEEFYLQPYTFVGPGVIIGANMAFRRKTLEVIGGFDERFGSGTQFSCEDIDAVASALWRGIPGAYCPQPTVYHNHGRNTVIEGRMLYRTYNEGAGAYYAKYLSQRSPRWVYARGWLRTVETVMRSDGPVVALKRFARESYGAMRYVSFCLKAKPLEVRYDS